MKDTAVQFPSVKRNSAVRSLLLAAVGSGLCLGAVAADVNLTEDSLSSGANGGWNNAAAWSNGEAPSAANNYFTNGFNLSTQHNAWLSGQGTVTFAGGSLTATGATRKELVLRANIVNISNLTLGNITVRNRTSPSSGVNQLSTLNIGTLRLIGTGANQTIAQGDWNGQDIIFNVQNLAGDGFMQFTTARSFTLNVTSAAGFTGGFDVASGATAVITGNNLLIGSGSFSMASGASLTLDKDLNVGSFVFAGTSLESGVYDSARLNELFSTSAFSGAGSLSVAIPEASTSALLGAVVVSIALVTRRSLRGSRRCKRA